MMEEKVDASVDMGEFLSLDENSPVNHALLEEKFITLCLSQDVNSELASCWNMGLLPTERQWRELTDIKVDVQFAINDPESCLHLLAPENSEVSRFVIDILVVKLNMTTRESPCALDDLLNTLRVLRRHLINLQHVVISVTEFASLFFSVQDSFDEASELPQTFDNQQRLCQIVNDLYACWNQNHRLTARSLFDFYFKGEIKPASEVYLARFVVSLSDLLTRALFITEALHSLSTKIMWVCHLKSSEDYECIKLNATRMCHAICLDMRALAFNNLGLLGDDRLRHALSFENNTSIERIMMWYKGVDHTVQLPRPSTPLTDAASFSALIELTLRGDNIILDLTQLNQGHFPKLTHLSVLGGEIKGHLDSRSVSSLETLKLEFRDTHDYTSFEEEFFVHDCVQSLLHAGCPWQLVATQQSGGWSLASYDEPITTAHNDAKDDLPDSPQILPFIRELLLVMICQENAQEWQSRLQGNSPLEAAADGRGEGLLMWTPENVQKITAYCTSGSLPRFNFEQTLPGQRRILTSLKIHNICVTLNSSALSQLQSLEVNSAPVELSGCFAHLEKMSLRHICLEKSWELAAPLLQSFSCRGSDLEKGLIVSPHLLPNLSYLEISSWIQDPIYYPKIILVQDDVLGLSRVNHVVLGKNMRLAPNFEQWQVQYVSHLKLEVNPLELPKSWSNTEWTCEILELKADPCTFVSCCSERPMIVTKLPLLPLVRILAVTEKDCRVMLDTMMPHLTECTLPSPRSFGPELKCPALRRICFTEELSVRDRRNCLDRATYVAMGAQPSEVYFAADDHVHTMTWDMAPCESDTPPLVVSLEGDDACVLQEYFFSLPF